MTDKDKIERIIEAKDLNSKKFCDEVCITPATLSHIRSGRTAPTLNVLRNILQAFPDINPLWLFNDEGEMLLDTHQSAHGVETPSGQSAALPVNSANAVPMDLFAQTEQPTLWGETPSGQTSRQPSARPETPSGMGADTLASIRTVMEDVVRQQRPSRKVVEVRIFFDDGTYESFTSH